MLFNMYIPSFPYIWEETVGGLVLPTYYSDTGSICPSLMVILKNPDNPISPTARHQV